ncbi:MAG: hypothetical protein EON60_05665 [Alphaproteobacteria bacterium]|nr:MAG: hypothetical protein EON60_05665 [Alphaproteobacteria bacterium]
MQKVLIACNNPHILKFFQQSGIPLAAYTTANTALAYLEEHPVQAVILTEELPDGTNGLLVYRALRNQLGRLDTPVTLFADSRHMHVHVADLAKTDPHIRVADTTTDLPSLVRPLTATAA